MKKYWIFFVVLALFVILLAGGSILYKNLSAEIDTHTLVPQTEPAPADPKPPVENESAAEIPPADPGKEERSPAPEFTVYDREGNAAHLSDFKGKPVILNFWATWCTYCKMHMPVFEEAYETHGEDIHFVMVNLTDGSRETVEGASSYIEENGYTFPVYFDTEYSAAMAYGTSSIPVTFFIDAEGNAVVYGMGALDAETLQTGIDMIYNP